MAAASTDNRTFYLYGAGLIGELTDNWSYSLPDGSNTARQLTNQTGGVTLVTSYTPLSREGMLREGDLLDVRGEGSFTFGYFGGVTLAHARRAGVDTATGLMYIGNGQYYDPSTGRFLNRSAKPQQANPYVPWSGDPAGMLVAPLSLLGLLLGKKKKRGKLELVMVILVLGLSLGISLTGCGYEEKPTDPPSSVTVPPENGETPEGNTVTRTLTLPSDSSFDSPTATCIVTATSTPTRYYDRQAAIQFARDNQDMNVFGSGGRTVYNSEFDSNCANFVSYALFEGGGLKTDDDWYVDSGSWVRPVELYQYLKGNQGFIESDVEFLNTAFLLHNTKDYANPTKVNEGLLLLPLRKNNDYTNKHEQLVGMKWIDYLNQIQSTKPGDIIFFENENKNGWTHVGIITGDWQSPTTTNYTYINTPYHDEPRFIDHSGISTGERSIGDTHSLGINKVKILHAP